MSLSMHVIYCNYYFNNICVDINECSSNNGGCQHNCYNTVGSYYCTCNTGWVLSSNGQTCTGMSLSMHEIYCIIIIICVDAIECSSSINGGCDQNCYNTVGSYYCTCNTGWVLASNGQTCTGMELIHSLDFN